MKASYKRLFFFASFVFSICYIIKYIEIYINTLPPQLSGHSIPPLRELGGHIRDRVLDFSEKGGSLYGIKDGERIFEFKFGYADAHNHQPWLDETITRSHGLSSIIPTLSFALLVDRHVLRPDTLIKDVFPEFLVPNVTVESLLTHSIGYPFLRSQISILEYKDYSQETLQRFFKETPVVEFKPHFHYHTLHIIADAIVRQVDHRNRTLAYFFMEEIAWPLNLDISVGISRCSQYRVAQEYYCSKLDKLRAWLYFDFSFNDINSSGIFARQSIRNQTVNLFYDLDLLLSRNVDIMEIPLSSLNTYTNGKNLARLFDEIFISKTPSSNFKLFSKSTIEWLLTPLRTNPPLYDIDPVLDQSVRYTLAGLRIFNSPRGSPIYGAWDDIMGQFVLMDPEEKLSIAYVTNHAHCRYPGHDSLAQSYIQLIYDLLE